MYKLENIAIEKIYKSDKNKNGEKYISAKGNPFKKVDIYISKQMIDDPDFEGRISLFDYFGTADNWEVGTLISGIVEKNGTYFNFQLPNKKQEMENGLKEVKQEILELRERVEKLEGKGTADSTVDELPF